MNNIVTLEENAVMTMMMVVVTTYRDRRLGSSRKNERRRLAIHTTRIVTGERGFHPPTPMMVRGSIPVT